MHGEIGGYRDPGTPCGNANPQRDRPGVGARACVRATACVTETPIMEETPCVSGVVASVPKCVLPSTPCEEEASRVKGRVCE